MKSITAILFSMEAKLLGGIVLVSLVFGSIKKWYFWDIILFPLPIVLVYALTYLFVLVVLKFYRIGNYNQAGMVGEEKNFATKIQHVYAKYVAVVLSCVLAVMMAVMV